MPLHAYEPLHPPCRLCGPGFEHRSAAGEPPLTACPTCGQAVRRAAMHPVNVVKLTAAPSVSTAKSAGFSVLRRTCDGNFEKL